MTGQTYVIADKRPWLILKPVQMPTFWFHAHVRFETEHDTFAAVMVH